MLLFKKKFIDAIRNGAKTQTIRLSRHRQFRAGQRSYIPGAGYIRITKVEAVEIAKLTDDDARPDGFETADALRDELQNLYGEKLSQGYGAWRIVFQLLPPDEQERIKAEKAAAKTVQ